MVTVFEVGAALLGACIGSFLNVVIWRLQQDDPSRRSLLGRSRCPHCGAAIPWHRNVPVLAWLLLRGRAACCGKPIAVRYPFVEALTAALFLLLATNGPGAPYVVSVAAGTLAVDPAGLATWAALAVFVSLLVALTFIDFDRQILPDALTKPGIALGIAAGFWPGVAGELGNDPNVAAALRTVLASVVGALVGGGVTWAIRGLGSVAFRREAMGFGDVKLMAMIGAFVGWRDALLALLLGCALGALSGGLGILFGGSRVIPFGPYLAMGAVLTIFLGDALVHLLFVTWPEWQRRHDGMQWAFAGAAMAALFLLFLLVRRSRRAG
ncbi:MAG: prepilin peptidase [Planctomycetota bacterium]|jgi:leader peptidase (prepilin peptidase)/N-methyltransferase